MPTYEQLQAEPWWSREFAPDSMVDLRRDLLAYWKLSGSAIGIKGNNVHLRGYHRSREWVKNSAYCTNRSYSVSETAGNKSGGDSRWLAGMDITLPTTLLLEVCKRLDVAVRSGTLEKVTEWYGNLDGDTIVDGYNNIANRVASSDSSHLWHLHISLDRGRAGEDHTDLYETLTGDEMVNQIEWNTGWLVQRGVLELQDAVDIPPDSKLGVTGVNDFPNPFAKAFKTLQADVAALKARPAVQSAPVDPATLKAVLLDPEVLAAVAKAVNEDSARRMAQ